MAYDEKLAARLETALQDREGFSKRKMFGGLCLMINGHMTVGVTSEDMMVRVGPDGYEDALAQPHARAMDFTGKPLAGMVYVAKAGVRTKRQLDAWVARGLAFVEGLPPKKAKTTKKK
ncbi:MAG: TfoX/Sxy family protein [Myxococcales bacterium]|nr:TfoX/Sxy family protein [Myxococcales bacterium]